jgi:lambda family phage portal protein
MKLFDKLLSRLGYHKQVLEKREFNGASLGRLTNDWLAGTSNADTEIRSSLATLRNRCRDLERSNDYARRYLALLENNVLGHCGIGLQMKIREFVRKEGKLVEQYDTRANSMIETHWEKWGRAIFCTVSGGLTWTQAQQLVLRSTARDGSILVRKHYPKDNPYRFALELIESDQLDTDYSTYLGNGSVVRLGKEFNAMGKCVAYHILRYHPGEFVQPIAQGKYRERVPAEQIIHVFRPERVGQSGGFPWLVSSMLALKHLAGFQEAVLVHSRAAAAKMGFLKQSTNTPGTYPGQQASDGSRYMETEPGVIEVLPQGMEFQAYDPSCPSSTYADYSKAVLRGLSAGLNVSYNSLANDLENVNYSSIRAGLLDEREEWKKIQSWFVDCFVRPVFEEWLAMALTAGAISDNGQVLPAAKLDKFNTPEFKPRRWDWVDPLKDMQANVLAVEKGFKSRRAIISEGGGDIEDVFKDIAADEQLAEDNDLDFDEDSSEQANAQQETPDAPDNPKTALTKTED